MIDEYGNGRLSVIKEMIDFLDKEIELQKHEKEPNRKMIAGNFIKAFIKVRQKLNDKKLNTLQKATLKSIE